MGYYLFNILRVFYLKRKKYFRSSTLKYTESLGPRPYKCHRYIFIKFKGSLVFVY